MNSADDKVTVLEASGHTMVYVNGEPSVGDPYANGYVRLPVKLRRGPNTFLFQGSVAATRRPLTAPRAPTMLGPDDVTSPDLVVGEPVNTEAAIVLCNASEQ